MKDRNDEELQKWLDENRHTPAEAQGNDEKTYHLLFNLLETEPDNGLPFDFSAKVTRRLQQEKRRNSELRSYLLSLAVVAVVVMAFCVLLSLVKNQPSNSIMALLIKYKWALIFSVFMLLTVQYLDAVFVKSNIFKRR